MSQSVSKGFSVNTIAREEIIETALKLAELHSSAPDSYFYLKGYITRALHEMTVENEADNTMSGSESYDLVQYQ
jgi:hypothetical protein